MINSNEIKCILCEKKMENWSYENRDGSFTEIHPVSGGLSFRTYGHYGSVIFDPMGTGECLDITICDLCIMKNLDSVKGTGKQGLLDNVDMLVDAAERHG
jgi:hypothetical protein